MLNVDEDAVICDLAETYRILNYRELPVKLLATLCFGLRDNSRIKMKLSGAKAETDTILLAAAVDRLSFLSWTKTKDGAKGRNRPNSIVSAIIDAHEREEYELFDTPEEFEAIKRRIQGKE